MRDRGRGGAGGGGGRWGGIVAGKVLPLTLAVPNRTSHEQTWSEQKQRFPEGEGRHHAGCYGNHTSARSPSHLLDK